MGIINEEFLMQKGMTFSITNLVQRLFADDSSEISHPGNNIILKSIKLEEALTL